MPRIRSLLFVCAAILPLFAPAWTQPRIVPGDDPRAPRPLSELLGDVERHFQVRISCKRFDPDTVRLAFGAFRMRPYSLDETLDNLLRPLDLVWSRKPAASTSVPAATVSSGSLNGPVSAQASGRVASAPTETAPGRVVTEQPAAAPVRITVQPYEYYRRTPADGERLLRWLTSLAPDRGAWEQRRSRLLAEARAALDLGPFCRGLVADPDVRLGRRVRHDGYATQNYALETLPGLYVCGTIYMPLTRGRHPLVVSPSGHWEGGRYRPDQQLRMATLARMGAVAVDMDIFGWGDSERQVGREAHTQDYAMQIQVLWSRAVTDWILSSRRDIDTARMAATGGSGGATHALLLALVDDRFTVLAPVVHLVSHFDGGCPCESGRPVTLAAGGSCMPELLAAVMAPHPVLTVSDGGDWTATYPTLEYPFLRWIWGLYGAAPAVRNVHLEDERHDYGTNKRRAVYAFLAETLGLDPAQADESRVELLPAESLGSFGEELPDGAIRSRSELEQLLKKLE